MKRGTSRMKRTRLRPRSAKMEAVYEERRPLVAEILRERPTCQARVFGVCTVQSTDVHEILTRARSGNTAKAILDRSNLKAICRQCHQWVGDHPTKAGEMGLTKHAWEATK